jgi:GNAT superfamily N-acetyltransferase
VTDPVLIRRAVESDAVALTARVADAYARYIARIGRRPKPMTADQGAAVRDHDVWVAVDPADDTVIGVLELILAPDRCFIEDVAVAPTRQGEGLGGQLLDLAESEARRRGYDEIGLETNEHFVENRAIYARRGYVETGRTIVGGTVVIQFAKRLEPG